MCLHYFSIAQPLVAQLKISNFNHGQLLVVLIVKLHHALHVSYGESFPLRILIL